MCRVADRTARPQAVKASVIDSCDTKRNKWTRVYLTMRRRVWGHDPSLWPLYRRLYEPRTFIDFTPVWVFPKGPYNKEWHNVQLSFKEIMFLRHWYANEMYYVVIEWYNQIAYAVENWKKERERNCF